MEATPLNGVLPPDACRLRAAALSLDIHVHTHTHVCSYSQMFFFSLPLPLSHLTVLPPPPPAFHSTLSFLLTHITFSRKQSGCKHRVAGRRGGRLLLLPDRHSTWCLTVRWVPREGITSVCVPGEEGCTVKKKSHCGRPPVWPPGIHFQEPFCCCFHHIPLSVFK